MDTIVTPASATGTVVTGTGSHNGNWHRGLEGKDVAAINEMFTLQALRNITTDIHQNARDIEVNVEKSGRANELATEKTAAATALALATNTAAILAAQATCCCEIKELVRADGQATRDLINSLNTQNLQAQLAAMTNEANLLKLKIAGIAVPV